MTAQALLQWITDGAAALLAATLMLGWVASYPHREALRRRVTNNSKDGSR